MTPDPHSCLTDTSYSEATRKPIVLFVNYVRRFSEDRSSLTRRTEFVTACKCSDCNPTAPSTHPLVPQASVNGRRWTGNIWSGPRRSLGQRPGESADAPRAKTVFARPPGGAASMKTWKPAHVGRLSLSILSGPTFESIGTTKKILTIGISESRRFSLLRSRLVTFFKDLRRRTHPL